MHADAAAKRHAKAEARSKRDAAKVERSSSSFDARRVPAHGALGLTAGWGAPPPFAGAPGGPLPPGAAAPATPAAALTPGAAAKTPGGGQGTPAAAGGAGATPGAEAEEGDVEEGDEAQEGGEEGGEDEAARAAKRLRAAGGGAVAAAAAVVAERPGILTARELAFERNLRGASVRTEPLGTDRCGHWHGDARNC